MILLINCTSEVECLLKVEIPLKGMKSSETWQLGTFSWNDIGNAEAKTQQLLLMLARLEQSQASFNEVHCDE